MIKLFKSSQFSIQLSLIAVFFILQIVGSINSVIAIEEAYFQTPINNFLYGLASNQPITSLIINFFILLIITLVISWEAQKKTLFSRLTYMPSFVFLIGSALIVRNEHFYYLAPALFFMFLAYRSLINAYHSEFSRVKYLNASSFIAIASLIWPPCFFFIILIAISIIIHKNFNWRSWVLSLYGFIISYSVYIAVLFICNIPITDSFEVIEKLMKPRINFVIKNQFSTYIAGIYLLFVLISIFYLLSNINEKLIENRKIFGVNIWMALISFFICFISHEIDFELMITLGIIPFSMLLSNYLFYNKSKNHWIINLSTILFIFLAIIHLFI